MSDPIRSISALLDEIAGKADFEDSIEWYLRSYLIDYKRVLLRRASIQEVEFATTALMRFCAESLDTEGRLYQACAEIAEQGAAIARR